MVIIIANYKKYYSTIKCRNSGSRNTCIDGVLASPNAFRLLLLLSLVPWTEAQSFDPILTTTCLNGLMSVSVRTYEPYEGIIFARDHKDSCRAQGTGDTLTIINVPLTAYDECGVVYNSKNERYSVILNVHQHASIIVTEDKAFNVSCPPRSQDLVLLNGTDGARQRGLPVQMGIYESSGRKVHRTVFGRNYTVRLSSLDGKDFTVTSCMGFAGHNYSLQMSTFVGCSINKDIISHFKYDPVRKVSEAKLQQMFKFPTHNVVHLQCAVVYCSTDGCPRTDCDRRRDDPSEQAGNLLELPDSFKTGSRDLHEHRRLSPSASAQSLAFVDGKESYASTTVGVADIENITEVVYAPGCGSSFGVLVALCVIFGVLLVISIVINVAFCVMTSFGEGICPNGSDGPHSLPDKIEYITADAAMMQAIESQSGTGTIRPFPALLWYPPGGGKAGKTAKNGGKKNRHGEKTGPNGRNSNVANVPGGLTENIGRGVIPFGSGGNRRNLTDAGTSSYIPGDDYSPQSQVTIDSHGGSSTGGGNQQLLTIRRSPVRGAGSNSNMTSSPTSPTSTTNRRLDSSPAPQFLHGSSLSPNRLTLKSTMNSGRS